MQEILKNPKTVKDMAEQIKYLCDGYWSRKITEKEARELIHYWENHEGDKLFKATEFNPTIKKIIGKRRVKLIEKWLQGCQIKIL
ncbi:uncharacterized protein (TIGR04540 family) [Alkalibaculum bacchi]|uniref:Uncharacterized protein (TIGR04540 family) n=1 Tax=Alkalibaculum bacchi TaxID=645887 RepID=A0A366HYU1_9FIRM|nr:TIGR04540 family protein [Alkalibaculum bacchi]RBP59313.1 uncharacterized protein (TIGR04540 family) [Alkalibaculum bacchi]